MANKPVFSYKLHRNTGLLHFISHQYHRAFAATLTLCPMYQRGYGTARLPHTNGLYEHMVFVLRFGPFGMGVPERRTGSSAGAALGSIAAGLPGSRSSIADVSTGNTVADSLAQYCKWSSE
eukprot:3923296-Rhodomonas_salina.1